jgi:hypothetical protein
VSAVIVRDGNGPLSQRSWIERYAGWCASPTPMDTPIATTNLRLPAQHFEPFGPEDSRPANSSR